MAVKQIIVVPDKRLNAKCDKVTEFGNDTKNLIQDLKDTLQKAKNPEGAGLAAPQIGVLKRVCVVRNFYEDPTQPGKSAFDEFILVNPKIISKSKDTEVEYEGCLSIPNILGKVERHRKIKIKAQDENGEPFRLTASGYFAAIVQHEMDHLDGVLFTDKLIGDVISSEEYDNLFIG